MLSKQAHGLACAGNAALVCAQLSTAGFEFARKAQAAQSIHCSGHRGISLISRPSAGVVMTLLCTASYIQLKVWNNASMVCVILQDPGNCTLVVGATGGVGQVLTGKLLDVGYPYAIQISGLMLRHCCTAALSCTCTVVAWLQGQGSVQKSRESS